ncbi:hypothetical protein SmJEL517_g01086 [Synchytrium microbalum]|uniref:Protein kinase domain-containing protein n=1 Tax=Synchytrium microbalum TaxID=1806994 RepID=A0A507C794_9FUNG|nr:uncharacterized protein SmJEL517_g01086 [Synchytrium microbalum]TPX36917.1 hypothetical protein SmJEL517_g01086 [Synchytrium microbalum]
MAENERRDDYGLEASALPAELKGAYDTGIYLGRGGYATVFQVTNKSTKSEYAMKVVHKNKVQNKKRLEVELEVLRRAQHPRIVCLQQAFITDDHIYLIIDLCEGGCLFDRIMDVDLTEPECSKITHQLLDALAYLHSIGIVHRDVKLENVLMTSKTLNTDVKLADFGVVRIRTVLSEPVSLDESESESEESLSPNRRLIRGRRRAPSIVSYVGSVCYMAPDIFLGVSYDEAVDMWAVGVLVFMMLSLTSPFGNDEADPRVEPDQIARIVKADYNFDDSIWETKSICSQNFISKLLKFNALDRMSANEALQHPWIKIPSISIPLQRDSVTDSVTSSKSYRPSRGEHSPLPPARSSLIITSPTFLNPSSLAPSPVISPSVFAESPLLESAISKRKRALSVARQTSVFRALSVRDSRRESQT